MIIVAIFFGIVGIGALLYFEAKIIGMIFTGIAAIFLLLNFVNTQEASTQQTKSTKQRDSAEFDRDFAKVSGTANKDEMKILNDRVDVAIKKESENGVRSDKAFNEARTERDDLKRRLNMDDTPVLNEDGTKKQIKQLAKE